MRRQPARQGRQRTTPAAAATAACCAAAATASRRGRRCVHGCALGAAERGLKEGPLAASGCRRSVLLSIGAATSDVLETLFVLAMYEMRPPRHRWPPLGSPISHAVPGRSLACRPRPLKPIGAPRIKPLQPHLRPLRQSPRSELTRLRCCATVTSCPRIRSATGLGRVGSSGRPCGASLSGAAAVAACAHCRPSSQTSWVGLRQQLACSALPLILNTPGHLPPPVQPLALPDGRHPAPPAPHPSCGGGSSRSAPPARLQQRQAAMASGAERIKQLFKKYGKIALGVHLCVYGTFLTGERRRGGRAATLVWAKLCNCGCRAVSCLRV